MPEWLTASGLEGWNPRNIVVIARWLQGTDSSTEYLVFCCLRVPWMSIFAAKHVVTCCLSLLRHIHNAHERKRRFHRFIRAQCSLRIKLKTYPASQDVGLIFFRT